MRVSTSILAMMLISCSHSVGQTTTYYWNFGDSANGANPQPTGTNSNLTIGNFGIGNTLGSVIPYSQISASSGYTGASGSYNIGNAARAGALNTATGGSAYFTFTITPTSGATGIQIGTIEFGSRSTATGPQAIVLRSSMDGFMTDITQLAVPSSSAWVLRQPTETSFQSLGANNPIEFRLYGFNGTGSPPTSTINWRIDDFTINVTPVPEPGSILAIGAAVMGVGAFVRRKFRRKTDAAEAIVAA